MSNHKHIFDLERRRKIYEIVKNNAGCHLRKIQREAELSFGSVSYQLSYLKKHHLIKEEKDGRNVRYFPLEMAIEDEKLLMLLRQESVRAIILHIMSHEECTHQSITAAVRLSPSTITWHLKKLLVSKIVHESKRGKYKSYSLAIPKSRVMNLLIMYRESFLDTLVNGLIDLWERP